MAFDLLKKALGFRVKPTPEPVLAQPAPIPESAPPVRPPKVAVVRPDADRCPACGLSPVIWRATSGNCGCSECARKV